jgi:hypothetical protein
VPLCLLALTAQAQAAQPAAFKRSVAGAEVDFGAGVITAQAGAAADLHMPGANAARPGAERRARAAAESTLQAAVRALGLEGRAKDKTVLEHAAVSRIEYQSNGGVVLWLTLRFSDLAPARATARAIAIPTMPLEFAPKLVVGGKEVGVAFATYRPASDCPEDAMRARRDEKGRLVLAAAGQNLTDSLAGSAVVIYLGKVQP